MKGFVFLLKEKYFKKVTLAQPVAYIWGRDYILFDWPMTEESVREICL